MRFARLAGVGNLSERFAGVDVGNVDFDRGDCHRLERVQNRNACVGVSRGVNHNPVKLTVGFLDFVNNVALVVRLEALHLTVELFRPFPYQRKEHLVSLSAVDFRLANAEHIDIGPVDYQNVFHCNSSKIRRTTASTLPSAAIS